MLNHPLTIYDTVYIHTSSWMTVLCALYNLLFYGGDTSRHMFIHSLCCSMYVDVSYLWPSRFSQANAYLTR